MEAIKLLELFSGIQSQERALRQLKIPYESIGVCELDKDCLVSSAAMRFDLANEIANYEFPSQDIMIEELQAKNIGYSFEKNKHSITSRTPIDKLKQYYISDKLLKNIGDISLVKRLPYADFVTYSSPCQSFSVAGKLGGAAKTCKECGYKWDIDFNNPDYNYKCPNCGSVSLESTTSGLLQEVQRLLSVAYENNELPKYLLLENVKNLVGKQFKPQFDAWLKWLDSIGYNTYYKVLNSKKFGIPQNRERVFAISIRKDIDTGYTFPEEIPLIIRLKDVLEKNVDEKYYLPDDRIEKILNSSFMQEKKRIQMTDVCDTLLARDWKDPKCVPVEDEINVIGNYMPSNHDASRVVDVDGIAPTVKENHGTVTAIAEPQDTFVRRLPDGFSIARNDKKKSTVQGSKVTFESADTIDTITVNHHGKIAEPFCVASRGRNPKNPSDRTTGAPTEQRLEPNFSGTTNCLTSVAKDNYVCVPVEVDMIKVEVPQIVRVRKYEVDVDGLKSVLKTAKVNCNLSNKEIADKLNVPLTLVEHWFRQDNCFSIPGADIWFNLKDLLNITTDEFDPSITEFEEKEGVFEKSNRLYHSNGIAPTLTCGNNEKIIVENNIEPQLVGGIGEKNFGKQYRQGNRIYDSDAIAMALTAQPLGNAGGYSYLYVVNEPIIYDDYNSRIPEDQDAIITLTTNCGASAERNGVKILEATAIVEDQFPGSRDARIYKEYAPTLRQNCGGLDVAHGEIVDYIKWRIRKLTAKECWRLMGFTDEDVNRASKWVSNSTLYKTAGNSIVTSCLIGLFSSLFIEDGHKADVWTKCQLHYSDK